MFDAARDFYGSTLRWTMRHRALMLLGSVVLLVLIVRHLQMVPQGFIPRQDTGVIFGNTRAPEGITFAELERRQKAVVDIVRKHPDVDAVQSSAGQGTGGVIGDNIGRLIIRLKPRKERKLGADQVIQELRRSFAGGAQGMRVFMSNPPSINIGGLIGNADYQMVVQGPDLKPLYAAAQELEDKLRESAYLREVSTSLELRNPEIQIRFCATARLHWACLRSKSKRRCTTPTAAARSARCTARRTSTSCCSSSTRASRRTSMRCVRCTCSRAAGRMVPIQRRGGRQERRRSGLGEPLRAIAGGHAVLQSGAQTSRSARPSTASKQLAREHPSRGRDRHDGGQRQGVPGCVPHAARSCC